MKLGAGNCSAAQGGNNRQEINYNNKHYVAVCWLGGSKPDDMPSKAVMAVKNYGKKLVVNCDHIEVFKLLLVRVIIGQMD